MSRVVTTHVTVNAPVGVVWNTLTDLTGYARWNPFIIAAAGAFDLGGRLDLTIQPPGSRARVVKPWVTAVEAHRYLEWLGRVVVPGVLDGRHSFTLTPMATNRTLLQQSETFTGALVPFTGLMLTRTRTGFTAMNEAIAKEAERSGSHQLDDPTRFMG